MEMWKATLFEAIKEIQEAREDDSLARDKVDRLTEIIVDLQNVIED